MALLPAARLRVTTAAGTPVSGGKLRLYNAGTTTLSSIFSDAALTVPLVNPVVAASDGFLAQIFASEGLVCDGDYLTAGDVVIAGQSFVNAVFVGANTGSITRDFTNSRLKISGTTGTVSVEAGDPTGDDVGGKMRLGGYSATQGDTLSLDFAAINTTTDDVKVNSKRLTGVVYTPATTVTTQSTVPIQLPNAPSGVRGWEIDVWDIICSSTSGVLGALLSYDGGGSYKSGASDYYAAIFSFGAGADNKTDLAATTSLQITTTFVTPSNQPGSLKFRVFTPNSGSFATNIRGRGDAYDGSSKPYAHIFTGAGLGGYGRATHIQLSKSVGTLSLVYRVTPLRGTGD